MKRALFLSLFFPLISSAADMLVIPTNRPESSIVLSAELESKMPGICVGQLAPRSQMDMAAQVPHVVIWRHKESLAACAPEMISESKVRYFALKRYFNEIPLLEEMAWHKRYGMDPLYTVADIYNLEAPFTFRGNLYTIRKLVKGYLYDGEKIWGRMTANVSCVLDNPHRSDLIAQGMNPMFVPMYCDNGGKFFSWTIDQLDELPNL